MFGLQARFSFPPPPTPAPLLAPPFPSHTPPPDQLSPPSLVESFNVGTLVHLLIIVLFVAGEDTLFLSPIVANTHLSDVYLLAGLSTLL